ncbi:MAG: dTMP kinase [Clostridia bacterium]|nr:dTMP kinase [Clostridia bacterium]
MTVQPQLSTEILNENTKGKFIVFEGIDGAGKSTQIALLEKRLKSEGITVVTTAEPTPTAMGGLIRDALSGASPKSSCELAAMFLSDRISHNISPIYGIQRLINDGTYVICDRYYYSSFAYQGLDTDIDWVMDINLNCPQILKPDVCIFLDLDPSQSARRLGDSRAFLEIFEKTDTLEKIRSRFFDVFRLLGERENIRIVDASQSIEDVAQEVYRNIF